MQDFLSQDFLSQDFLSVWPAWALRSGLFGVLFVAAVVWSGCECGNDWSRLPGKQQDDVFYDHLAWNIAGGNGFAFDFQDAAWKQAYTDGAPPEVTQWIDSIDAQGPTMCRAPGYPAFLATVYRLVGRNFAVVRWIQVALLVAALTGFLVWASRHLASPWIGAVAAATLAADFGVLRTAGQIMSESLGVVLVLIAVMLVATACQRKKSGWSLVAGISFGVAMLVRSTLAGWLVVAFPLLAAWLLVSWFRGWPIRSRLTFLVAFGLGVAAIGAPWWARNCMLSGTLTPLGTGGQIGMVGGFSEGCVTLGGNWSVEEVADVQHDVMSSPAASSRTAIENELAFAQASRDRALVWSKDNQSRLFFLSLQKALVHVGVASQPHPAIHFVNAALLLSALTMCFGSRSTLGGLILLVSVLSIVTTAITWAHFGRFGIPIRPLWHVASAWTTVQVWAWLLGRSRGRPSQGSDPD